MELTLQQIYCSKLSSQTIGDEKFSHDQEKLRGITIMVKKLKHTSDFGTIHQKNVPFIEIVKQGNFMLQYLSRQKVSDPALFFDILASLDSLMSIFKLDLFLELKFRKSFFKNIQRQFERLCLEESFIQGEKHQKQHQFQLYSILFLLVMMIYFSGKRQCISMKDLPLQFMNRTFISSLISLQINISKKNERIIGLILAYIVKKVNIKIYGQKILKFLLHHFDQIQSPRTVYHFVYCMREIHLQREIDIKILRRYNLVEKLCKFWGGIFTDRESIYLVEYISLVLKKYPSFADTLLKKEEILSELGDNLQRVNNLSIIHQGLILEIVTKITDSHVDNNFCHKLIHKAFETCHKYDFSLKVILYLIPSQELNTILQQIFDFIGSFKLICQKNPLKSIVFGLEILCEIFKTILDDGSSWGVISALRENLGKTLDDLKEFQICQRNIAQIEECFSRMISIQYQTLC